MSCLSGSPQREGTRCHREVHEGCAQMQMMARSFYPFSHEHALILALVPQSLNALAGWRFGSEDDFPHQHDAPGFGFEDDKLY